MHEFQDLTFYVKQPELFKGWKWLIIWEELIPGTTTKIRIRKTFDLNRAYYVARPELREQRAQEILRTVTERLAQKYKEQGPVKPELSKTKIVDAMAFALKVKCKTDREHTRITYTSFTNIFIDWLRDTDNLHLLVSDFSRVLAVKFLDWVMLERTTRKGRALSNRTYNNYILNMRSLFYELVKRGYMAENPFSNHKKRKEEQKLRHPFNQEDADKVARYVYRENKMVYLAILLISHCGLRISELRRLRARDFQLDRGLIVMGGDQTKNKDAAFITIPQVIMPTLLSYEIEKIPHSWLVFGEKIQPHPSKGLGRNTISNHFREMLRSMQKQKMLRSIEGYSAYSWKDTGAIAMVKSGMDILAIQKHLRHRSLETTQRYLQSLGIINRDVRDFKGIIFRLPTEFEAEDQQLNNIHEAA